jgi:hypothetical protein
VLPSTTANTSKLAEKVLDSTINIPPLIYQNQGGIVGIYVARDVDFSSVYELKPSRGSVSTQHGCEHDLGTCPVGWCGDATSVVEFLRPLRDQLDDAPGVLEVCVNRPGELLVETVRGWQTGQRHEMTQERFGTVAGHRVAT